MMTQASSDPKGRADQPLILSSRVNGTPVFNRNGVRIGHVDDLSIEKVGGTVIYAIISFGGFLGIGEKFLPVPWSLLDYDPEQGGYVLPLDEAELETAPHFAREELRALGGADYRRYGEEISNYYGSYGPMPFW
jgi:hypothetical protein